jgi:hypothetical protein
MSDPHSPFTAQEWSALEFAVLDVYWLSAAVDGKIDKLEAEALASLLSLPEQVEDELARAVLGSVAEHHEAIVAAYRPATRTRDDYEASLRKVGELVDDRLQPGAALSFKNALIDVGVTVANASGRRVPGRGRVSDLELVAIAGMSDWLGLPA